MTADSLAYDDGYYTFDPFFVFLPSRDDDGTLLYDVETVPKAIRYIEFPPEDEPEEYKVVKRWTGEDDADKRPESVTIEILCDGEVYDTCILSEENDWCYEWTCEAGGEWTVVERDVDESYTVMVEETESGWTVTNHYEEEPPEEHTDQPGGRPEPEEDMPAVAAGDLKLIGRLSVPALGLELPVCERWSSENASAAPCRYKGSAYDGSLIIAGHSFREHFGTLKELEYGDRVEFEDTEGYTFRYEVIRIEQIDGRDIQGMEEGEWDLTLLTCAWDNTKRIAVRCREEAK